MKFDTFAHYLARLEAIDSRLSMTEVLAELYLQLDPSERKPTSYLMQGSLVPPYQSLEFQLSDKMVLRSLARIRSQQSVDTSAEQTDLFGEASYAKKENELRLQYKKLGDLGELAENILASNKPSALTVQEVFEKLKEIAKFSGQGSQEQKVLGLRDLLQMVGPTAAKYIVRIVIGRLRLGFSTMTLLDALSWAMTGGKEHRDLLEAAYQKKADVGELASIYLPDKKTEIESLTENPSSDSKFSQAATKRLESYSVAVGIPVVPALCQRLETAAEMIEKMHEVFVEPKYDGLRLQLHIYSEKQGQTVEAFTRSLDDVSHMYPELLQLPVQIKCKSCILDCEAIGYDPQTGKLVPFQLTVTRKRKHDVVDAASKVPLRFYLFDILEKDGVSLIDEPLSKRKEILAAVTTDNDTVSTIDYIRTSDPEEIHAYHEQQLANGLEGAVIKKVDAPYVGGRKGWRWVKIKESEGNTGKLADTLDVVVMGYYYGKGKRNQFGIGAFLVGVLDQKADTIVTIAKIGTGLSDEQFKEMKKRCDAQASPTSPQQYRVPKGLLPDVWVAPGLLVEVAADELTNSPTHTAGKALRFPRLVSFRLDKGWQDATTVKELQKL